MLSNVNRKSVSTSVEREMFVKDDTTPTILD